MLLEAIAAYTAVARDRRCWSSPATTRSGCGRSSTPPATASASATSDQDRHPPGRVAPRGRHRRPGRGRGRARRRGGRVLRVGRRARPAGWSCRRRPMPPPATLETALAEAERQLALAGRRSSSSRRRARRVAAALAGAEAAPDPGRRGRLRRRRRPALRPTGSGASIGATLAVPLYQGGGEHARVRQSKESARAAPLRAATTRGGRRGGDRRRLGTTGAPPTPDPLARSSRSTPPAFALDGVRQEALVGARTVLDVLDAEHELFAAEVDSLRARARAGRSPPTACWPRSAGSPADDLALPVEPPRPEGPLPRSRTDGSGLAG